MNYTLVVLHCYVQVLGYRRTWIFMCNCILYTHQKITELTAFRNGKIPTFSILSELQLHSSTIQTHKPTRPCDIANRCAVVGQANVGPCHGPRQLISLGHAQFESTKSIGGPLPQNSQGIPRVIPRVYINAQHYVLRVIPWVYASRIYTQDRGYIYPRSGKIHIVASVNYINIPEYPSSPTYSIDS